MKQTFIRLFDKVIFKVLTLLGCTGLFAACYGTVEGTFWEIEGKVTAPDGEPIAGIRVSAHMEDGYPLNAVCTDEDGGYSMMCDRIGGIYVKAEDVDGAEGGGCFAADSAWVETYPVRGGGTRARAVNFTLSEQADE